MKIRFDGTVKFKPGAVWAVPALPGVYAIHDLRGTGYLGRSGNLRKRFREHLETSWNPLLDEFLRTAFGPLQLTWVLAEEPAELERFLVRELQPVANRIQYREVR